MIQRIASIIYKIGRLLIDLIIISIIFFIGINATIIFGTHNSIVQVQDIDKPLDAIVVLGASVQWLQLSPILQDRVETAIQLYKSGKTKKIIISGDNTKKYYNEVDAMYRYIINRGIPTSDIITDIYGESTYQSILHVRNMWYTNTIWIVTQNFHLPRAIFIAQFIWLHSIGISSDRASYTDDEKYELRESFARMKALFDVIWYYIF